jgi:hypothetical protein
MTKQQFIDGLRAQADLHDKHPELPLPNAVARIPSYAMLLTDGERDAMGGAAEVVEIFDLCEQGGSFCIEGR